MVDKTYYYRYALGCLRYCYSCFVNVPFAETVGMVAILFVFLTVVVYITVIFGIAWKRERLDIVDIAWGGAFIVAAVTSWLLGSKGWLQVIVTMLVVIWAIRLSSYILKRVVRSKNEDPRYAEMRKTWKGNAAGNAYTRIFLVQGILATVVSASIITVNLSADSVISFWTYIGILIWLIGFLFESIGDSQLRKHLASPENKGSLMTSGLWKYTRHPNYFGEAAQWWGIFVIALGVPFGWIAVISPLMITFLLLYVSGVPLTEKRFEGRPGWNDYKAKTSMFLPLPPRK
jgi:steroid 5-alpha reductase family enzyme